MSPLRITRSILLSISSIVRNESLPYTGDRSRWCFRTFLSLEPFKRSDNWLRPPFAATSDAPQYPFVFFGCERHPLGWIDFRAHRALGGSTTSKTSQSK